MRTSMFFYRIS